MIDIEPTRPSEEESMGIFRRGQITPPRRFRIKVVTSDGTELYWHKNGRLHTVEEDVADIFVAKFNPALFEILPDGSMTSPGPDSMRIDRLSKEPV